MLENVCSSYLLYCGRSVPHWVCRFLGCVYLVLILSSFYVYNILQPHIVFPPVSDE
jgi:hypothetical protein